MGWPSVEPGRTASQVLANLGAATLCALPTVWFPRLSGILLVGAMAVLAEAAADTASSEIGQASARHAYMITGFHQAPIGANGAISVIGTLAGCLAACLVAWMSAFVEVVNWNWTPVDCIGGHGRHVLRQHTGSDVGDLRQNGQRFRQLCEHGLRRRCSADGGHSVAEGREVRVGVRSLQH